ncbi:hypothetical protein MN116_004842 [Schistosoma mekongi]|uniref:Transmembrane protein 131-like N-terminal domain-containing protein n=1 Tax=Schistosoma mekongi TaxID=38744 RepID=A0AAE1ZDQ1_SCHME|nr:hypothetical protein MN116_004842 [Schistosoma mekongi]
MFFIILLRMHLYDATGTAKHFLLSLSFLLFYQSACAFCYDGLIENNREWQIVIDGIENFCQLKKLKDGGFGDDFSLFSGLSFQPSMLNFGEQPLSHPKQIEVTITNIDADQSIDLVTTFGISQFIFWSRFNQTAIPPASSANFNVTFLPYTVGEFETYIYIRTSLGTAKYQVFGSSYISDEYLIPVVNLESLDASKRIFELNLVNTLSFSIKVDGLKVISDKPYTECCSYSRVVSDPTSANDLINVHASVPRILHSHETTSLLKVTVNANENKIIQISSSICEYSQFKQYYLTSGNSADYTVFIKSLNTFSRLPSATTSTNELPDQDLYSRSSLLYFGTISRQSGSYSMPIEVLFPGDQPLEITSIEANIYDVALSINVTESIISPRTLIPKTVAIVTFTARLSYSYILFGVITVFTNVTSIYLRIPFYGRLIYGSLASEIQSKSVYLNENNRYQLYPILLFQFKLTNEYDFTVLVSKIDFLESIHEDLQIHSIITHPVKLTPNETILILSLSVVGSMATDFYGTIIVRTNVSNYHIPYNIHSGKLRLFISGTRIVNNIHLLGTILMGQTRNHTITVVNGNPIPIELKSAVIYTIPDDGTRCPFMKTSYEDCYLSGPCEKCTVQSIEMKSFSEVSIPFSWGSLIIAQHVKGFVQIHSKYGTIEQQFEYFVTRGLITVTPDPLIVNNSFPGKITKHKIVVQNTYPTDINITNIKLHSVTLSSNNFDNVLSFDAVQFYKIQQNGTLDNVDSPYSPQPIQFTVNQSRLVGIVYFDSSRSCTDIFEDINQYDTMSTNVTTSAVTNDTGVNHVPGSNKSLETVKPYCYCGFSLNTSSGMLWLKGVTETANQYNQETNSQSSINHLLVKETFRLYNELYSQWLKHSIRKDSSKESPVTTTTANKSSFNNTYVVNTISYELSNENITYYSDLSVQFTWPHIINTKKVLFNKSKMNSTFCTIKMVPYSKFTSVNRSLPIQHLLQIPTSSSKSTNSFECILQIINPQSTINPLFVQPVLWDQLFKNYATNAMKLNHLKELITNISADPTFVESLFTTDYGEFSIQPISHSQCESTTNQQFVNSLYPPGYILPSNGGEQYFRLMFRPYANLFELLRDKKTIYKSTIRSLLLIRNNLTSIEPLWLEMHFGHISLTFGMLSTPTITPSLVQKSLNALIYEFENEKLVTKHTISPALNIYLHDAPSSRLISSGTINIFTGLENNSRPSLKIDQILSNVKLNFSSLFNNYNNNTINQKIQKDLSLKFTFTEKTIGPLCELYGTKQIHHSPPPFQSKHWKQSTDTHHHTDTDFREDLLSTLSLRRRLILLNTGQITLNIFMLCFLPSDDSKQKSTGNIPIANHSSFLRASCNTAGFKIHPCILPPNTRSNIVMNNNSYVVHENSSNVVTLLPDQQLIIELRHYPDFTHTYLTANLIIKLYPTIFRPSVIQWWNSKQLNETNDHVLLINLPQILLEASFNSHLLSTCLDLLPRLSMESFLWIMVISFYLLNITVVIAISYIDAKEIYVNHITIQRCINELPENMYPDSTKRFNLNQLNNKLCVSCINTKHVCNSSHTILTTTSNSRLSSSNTLIKNHLLNNTNLETNEISTTIGGSKIRLKDKTNSDEQMKCKRTLLSTKSFWENSFQWILGLFFVIKYISIHWILIIITYPYKAMKRHIICMMKLKDFLNFLSIYHYYEYIRCFRHSASNGINPTTTNNNPGNKSLSSLNPHLSNDTLVVNRRNLFGFSRQSPNEEVKNQKIPSKSLSKNLPKLASQPLDKTTGTRVHRKKKTANLLVEISKPPGSYVNGSEDHPRSRLAKVEPLSSQPPLTMTTTPTSTIVLTTLGSKDVSPPRMAEADIVAAVQASIRLTEDVGSHHETRRKQSQRISSLTKCHNSPSSSPVSGPDAEDNSNVSNKSINNISMFYRNQTVDSPFSLRYKSNPVNKMPSLPPVDNKCEKEESKPTTQRMSFTKRSTDDYNEKMAKQSVSSQESLETANRKSVSPLQNSLNNKPNKFIMNSHQFSDTFNTTNKSLECPETIQTCFIPTNRMDHYPINDQYPLVIFPLWNEVGIPESTAYWSQPSIYSDEILFSTNSPQEAMNRLSEETHAFAQSFMTESIDLLSFHSQFMPSQFETTHFIQPTHNEDELIKDYYNQDKLVQNDDTISNILDTIKENDNNEEFLFGKNLLEYSYSSDIAEQNSLQFGHCSDFYLNRIAIENALNTTLPIICSLLQSNNSDKTINSNVLRSLSMTFPTYQDNNLCQIDTSLITQIFLNALDTALGQYVVETNPSYCSANTDVHTNNYMTIITNSSTDLSSEEILTDYHINNVDNDSIQHIDYNLHGSCKMNFYELSQITETRRLSVLNYEARTDSFIEEEMNVEQEYFDLVPNPVKGIRINSDGMNPSYSSWKSIVDIPQSELFQELELSETTFEQSTFVSSRFINYGNIFKESSAITPWTDIFKRVVGNTNSSNGAPLYSQDTCSSFSLSTTPTEEDMIGEI